MIEKMFALTDDQRRLLNAPTTAKVWLEGDAGTGKTTAGAAYLVDRIVRHGVPAGDVVVIVPQQTLAAPYHAALRRTELPAGGSVTITTVSGIAQEAVTLHWAQIARRAGFAHVDRPPMMLSLETAQVIMAQVVDPQIERDGYFDGIVLDRARLYSQLLDNLNKAALVPFPAATIGDRLKAALTPDPPQRRAFDQATDCALRFRAYCLQHNLLDFSLLIDTFMHHALPLDLPRLRGRYRHAIVDNLEEDTPIAHEVIALLTESADSALLIVDQDGGFRQFLGAAPDDAERLRALCPTTLTFEESLTMPPDLTALASALSGVMGGYTGDTITGDAGAAFTLTGVRFFPQMLDAAVDVIADAIAHGTAPEAIVVLAPFISDALRFSLTTRLEARGITTRSHRPSRALREEPVARALLTLAALAHPAWAIIPSKDAVAAALLIALGGGSQNAPIDPIRARLLGDYAYQPDKRSPDSPAGLLPFEALPAGVQTRISYLVGERYDALRGWLSDYSAQIAAITESPAVEPVKKGLGKRAAQQETPPPARHPGIDHFFSVIFGEVLSRVGFGFAGDADAARITANLIDSAHDFRRQLAGVYPDPGAVGRAYVDWVGRGLLANQYVRGWVRGDQGVLIAPAYTFLLMNQPADVQLWLDLGSHGWYERLYQPLTHPHVLSPTWTGAPWTDADEVRTRDETLYRLTQGLLRRCRGRLHFMVSEVGERGASADGRLLTLLQRLLRRIDHSATDDQAQEAG